ncbi:MAG: ADP-forming succinate--CoA ligase subunit beta [bacterium JZ-2024 1]
MKLHEFDAKKLVQKVAGENIPFPPFSLALTPEEVKEIARTMGKPVVVKAQVLVGGRGKAGGIQLANSPEEAEEKARHIFSLRIKGFPVRKVMVTEAVNILQEYYLGIVVDRRNRCYTAMACAEGGIDIEELASRAPEKIVKVLINPMEGFPPFLARQACFRAGFPVSHVPFIAGIFSTLYRVMLHYDADLLEINPLVRTTEEKILALDCKMTIDDNSLIRHADLLQYREITEEDPLEREAREKRIAYVRLDGDIGVVGNGAGLVMCTMDAVKAAGGQPACFLDLGGGSRAEVVRTALQILFQDPKIKSVFINIFGGITRGDEVAKGLLQVYEELQPKVPIIIRMTGTRAEEGLQILRDSPFIPAREMMEGAQKAVMMAKKEA